MTILASAIVDAAQEMLQDSAGTTYTTAQGLVWVNKGQRAIVNLRRDAGATTVAAWQLTAGIAQALAATYVQIIGDMRNMGTDGTTPGAAVFKTTRKELDAISPSWSLDANQAVAISDYMFDIDHAETWFCYPPSDGTGYVEASVIVLPPDLPNEATAISIPEQFEMALVHFVCWSWLAREDEKSPAHAAAQYHKQEFMSVLGLSGEAKEAVEP